jgi:hypothetical protein
MKGLENIGATCWLNALIQCLRVSRNWTEESPEGDSFTREFLRLVKCETDNTTDFLRELPMNTFGNNSSDSQEALLYILDRMDLKDFTGQVKQIVVFPGGRSETVNPCTVWFHGNSTKNETISGYEDHTGKIHNVAVIKRELVQVPEILVSDYATFDEPFYGKNLIGVVIWGMGHYVAYVKEAGDWWYVNDHRYIKKEKPNLSGTYLAFYGVGKTHTQRTHSQET